MKGFRSLALLLFLSTLATFAHADPVANDFQFQVLDPGGPAPLNYLDGTPFTVTFASGSACPTAVQNYAAQLNDALFGCYLAYNNSNYTFTSINLVFQNTTGTDPNTNLNGQSPNCLTNGAGVLTPAFGANPSCSLYYSYSNPPGLSTLPTDGQIYDLYYSGGAGLAPGSTLVLAEYGPDPSAFGTGVGTVTEAIPETPEPGSIVLLSTGTLCIGMLMARRRKLLA
jgi:hypothetical protein